MPVYLPDSKLYTFQSSFTVQLYDTVFPLEVLPIKTTFTAPKVLFANINITGLVTTLAAELTSVSVYTGVGVKDMEKTPRATMNEIIFRETDICTPSRQILNMFVLYNHYKRWSLMFNKK